MCRSELDNVQQEIAKARTTQSRSACSRSAGENKTQGKSTIHSNPKRSFSLAEGNSHAKVPKTRNTRRTAQSKQVGFFLYKILHDEITVPPTDIGIYRNPRATRGLTTKDKLLVPRCNTTELKSHFVARNVPEWNRLPDTITSADSAPLFRSRLIGRPRQP